MTKQDAAKKLKIADLNNICRTCLRGRVYLRDIHQSRLPKMIEYCTDIQISADDGLPSKICNICFRMTAKLFTFKKRIERSARLLRQLVDSQQFSKKRRDIIQKALNEADIHSELDMSVDVEEIIIKKANDEQEDLEDVPLKERLQMFTSDNDNLQINNDNKLNIEFHNSDSNSANFSVDNSIDTHTFVSLDAHFESTFSDNIFNGNQRHFDDSESVLNAHIFTVSPPPLIPLQPNKTTEDINSKDDIISERFKDLPPAPPLVPITENLVFTCSKCGVQFNTIDGLKEHKVASCHLKALQCNICHKVFKESIKLINHLKGHMVLKDYGCELCGKRYPNPSTLKVHMRTHTGERPFKCPQCGKCFTRWAGVVYHMRCHEPHKPFECETCGKRFKISSNLDRHKLIHRLIKPFCCSYCGKTFGQSSNYKLHIRTHHTNERPFLCSQCGKSFVSSTRLKRHMWCHSGFKPYKCQKCDKGYSNSTDLKRHQKTVHDADNGGDRKVYTCDKCNMQFMTYCLLRRHNVEHKRPFACDSCPKRFVKRSYLKQHIHRSHSKEIVEESSKRNSFNECQ